jgi:hypothetical protein
VTQHRRTPKLILLLAAAWLVCTPAALAGDTEASKSPWWVWAEAEKTTQQWWTGMVSGVNAVPVTRPDETPATDDGAVKPKDDHALSQEDLTGTEVKPTSVPIVDPDFLASMSFDPRYIDVPTWTQIRGPEAHAWARGDGQLVAVLDTGFNLSAHALLDHVHPFSYDAVDEDEDPNDLGNGIDDDGDGLVDGAVGHGTFVAGMVRLAAPEAEILAIRVGDDEGALDEEALLRGLQWARWMGARVVTLSLGVPEVVSPALRAELYAVMAAGSLVVVPAGPDEGEPGLQLWGGIVVGAVNAADEPAPFCRPPRATDRSEIYVFAPGVDLHGPLGFPRNSSVGWWSGAAFSAGIVSGAAALLYEVAPKLPLRVRVKTLRDAVAPVPGPDGEPYEHAGRIDLLEVVR